MARPFFSHSLVFPTPTAIAEPIPDGSITTPKLADGAVTTAKLADGAVTVDQLAINSTLTHALIGNSTTEVALIGPTPMVNLTVANYRGGNLLVVGNSAGWVSGTGVPCRLEAAIQVNSVQQTVSWGYMTSAVSGTAPWNLSVAWASGVSAGTHSVQLVLTRTTGTLEWRHIISNLLVLAFA